jgi:PAS domain S-box-containing protein
LEEEWPACEIECVQSEKDFVEALHRLKFDLILSDFSLPGFNGMSALDLAHKLQPETPYIFLSGTIGETNAVKALQKGATDYVIKDRPGRLIPAARRAIGDARERRNRIRVEQELRDIQQQFFQLAERSGDVFWISQPEPPRMLYISPAYEQVWGRPAAALLENPAAWEESIHPDDRQRVHDAIVACRTGTRPAFDEEYRILRPDGSERWVLGSAILLKDVSGGPVRISGIAKDITDRKRAARHIREQAEYLAKARDAIVVKNLDHQIVYWNHGAERILGWTADEALGRIGSELFGARLLEQIESGTDPAADDEWHRDVQVRDKLGRPLDLDLTVTLIRDEAGRPKSFLIIGTNITEKKKLEEQFLRVQRLESLGMLAAGIAHDLNNILSPVLMGAPLLRARLFQSSDLSILGTIERSAARGAALVKQILSFAHGTGGAKSVIQVRHLLTDIAELMLQTFPKSIRIDERSPGDLLPVVANPTQLHQVLLNLCVNARDAMPDGGTLRLRAENRVLDHAAASLIPDASAGSYLMVEVTDTGTGIPPEVLARIWDPFFTTKGEGKGTGLGLATVRGIVENHQGFVTVDSEVGRGTSFRIFLPAVLNSSAAGPATGSVHPFLTQGQGECVLVVDDESNVRDLIRMLLTTHGYRVLTAGDAAQALALAGPAIDEIALLVTDINMPGIAGGELARRLVQSNPKLKVLMMSGAGSGVPVVGRVLKKPFGAEELFTNVRSALDLPAGKSTLMA